VFLSIGWRKTKPNKTKNWQPKCRFCNRSINVKKIRMSELNLIQNINYSPHRTIWNQTCLVFNSIIIYFTDLFILYIFIQNAYAKKKYFKKGLQIMFNGSNCDRKLQLSRILTEPLNPREPALRYEYYYTNRGFEHIFKCLKKY